MPVRILIVVDLPAPLGPIKPSSSPFSISKEMPRRASTVCTSGRTSERRLPASPAALRLVVKVLRSSRTWIAGIANLAAHFTTNGGPRGLSVDWLEPLGKVQRIRRIHELVDGAEVLG